MPGPYLQTLGTGLKLIVALKEQPLSIPEAATTLDTNRSAVYRLMFTLQHHGFVERREHDGRYQLTPLVWDLGNAVRGIESLRQSVAIALRELARNEGEAASLVIYDSGDAVYIETAESQRPLGASLRPGARAPASVVAPGRVLLAYQGQEEIRRVARAWSGDISDSNRNLRMLNKRLSAIASSEYEIERDEWHEGLSSIAVPLLERPETPIGALAVTGPTARVSSNQEQLLEGLFVARAGIVGAE